MSSSEHRTPKPNVIFLKAEKDYNDLLIALVALHATYDAEPLLNSGGFEEPNWTELSNVLGRHVDRNNMTTVIIVSGEITEPGEELTKQEAFLMNTYKDSMYVYIHDFSKQYYEMKERMKKKKRKL